VYFVSCECYIYLYQSSQQGTRRKLQKLKIIISIYITYCPCMLVS